jgi:hypothetical protein
MKEACLFMADITRYTISHYGTQDSGPFGITGLIAQVYLYTSTSIAGTINFLSEGSILPKDTLKFNGQITMSLSYKKLPIIIDIVRNEKPLSLTWVEGYGVLATFYEPVGEEE